MSEGHGCIMAKKKVITEPAEDTGRWLVTFNDLMTLLLTFFVLILSMSSLDAQSVRDIQTQLLSALGVLEAGKMDEETIIERVFDLEEIGKRLKIFKNILPPLDQKVDYKEIEQGLPVTEKLFEDFYAVREEGRETLHDEEEYSFNQFREVIEEDFQIPGITILRRKRGVVLQMANNILFDPGQAALKKEGEKMLSKISEVLNETTLHISIEGHTDAQPIRTARYASNWELSVARAARVALVLQQQGEVDPARIGIAGYGDSRPVAPNDTETNRARNRRVEIILSRQQ